MTRIGGPMSDSRPYWRILKNCVGSAFPLRVSITGAVFPVGTTVSMILYDPAGAVLDTWAGTPAGATAFTWLRDDAEMDALPNKVAYRIYATFLAVPDDVVLLWYFGHLQRTGNPPLTP